MYPMFNFKTNFVAFLATILPVFLIAQTGSISGKIIDTKMADVVIGATVKLDDGGVGASSDLDGNFTIQKVAVGSHKLTITYLGYATKTISDINVKTGEVAYIDIPMEEAKATQITEVTIVATAKRESMSALTILQKNSPTIGDGVSSESIRRTPDRTTGDVIKRVSGASIQDNKFAIIRGLNDRYNLAMMNGALLSSTEPDRRAFSFDLFPSSMLDNLVVVKTASPDLPGEFAGGAILLNTKDIPEENYLNVQISSGYNTVTTFKPALLPQSGKSDWLGLDNGSRALPQGFPDREAFIALTKEEKFKTSASLPNDWALTNKTSTMPNTGFQISSGLLKKFANEAEWGTTLALSYSSNNKTQDGVRNDFDNSSLLFEFNDAIYKNNVLWGALLNSSFKINKFNKISFQNTFSTNTDNVVISRTGKNYENEQDVQATSVDFIENHLLTTRLSGEHRLTETGIKLNWGGGYNRSSRNVPSTRRMFYSRSFDADATDPFRAAVPIGSASRDKSGRFYSDLGENIYNGNFDLSLPFVMAGDKQAFKIGGLYQGKARSFDARVMGFIQARVGSLDPTYPFLPQSQIFAPEHFNDKGYLLDEITNKSDAYSANSNLNAGFAMFDNKFGRFRMTWGARFERFNQQLSSFDYTNTELKVDNTTTDILPSMNAKFEVTEKSNLRLSLSKTVSRPEFRELAPFSFYDFYLQSNITGNPDLKKANIYNADLRYEIFPGTNQVLSVSAFFKKFENPIENTMSSSGAGSRNRSFQNIKTAQNIGVEAEFRKNFAFLNEKLDQLVFFTNIALIKSKLDLSNVNTSDSTRSLQGQSPYVLNAGLQYNWLKAGLNSTLVFNMIGDRLHEVGTNGYPDIYERHRPLLDLSIAKKMGPHGEIKLTIGDIMARDFVYFQDNDASHTYTEKDNLIQNINFGTNVSLSFGYRF
jgi:TonB-dependent receptor